MAYILSQNKKRLAVVIMSALFLTSCGSGENQESAASSESTVSSSQESYKKLTPREISALNAIFQAKVEEIYHRYGIPGITAAYSLPQQNYISGFAAGMANKETGREMQPNTMMLSASIGKTVFGALTAVLYNDSVVSPEDLLSKWLGHKDWYKDVPNAETIKLKHLASHSAGVPDHVYSPLYRSKVMEIVKNNREASIPPEQLVGIILNEQPLFSPGAGYAYSDTGFILLGLALTEATGKNLYDLVQEFFIDPIGLHETIKSTQRFVPNMAQGYGDPTGARGIDFMIGEDGFLFFNPATEWTGGGFSSSSQDLVRWFSALFTTDVVMPNYSDFVLENAIAINKSDATNVGYGLGIEVATSKWGCYYSHGGWIPTYLSKVAYYPEANFSLAFMVNTDDPQYIDRKIRQQILEDLSDVIHTTLGLKVVSPPVSCVTNNIGE